MGRKVLKGQSKALIVVGERRDTGEFLIWGHPVDPKAGYRVQKLITVEQAKANPGDVMKYTPAQGDRWDHRLVRIHDSVTHEVLYEVLCMAVHPDQLDKYIAERTAERERHIAIRAKMTTEQLAEEAQLLAMLDSLPKRGAGIRR